MESEIPHYTCNSSTRPCYGQVRLLNWCTLLKSFLGRRKCSQTWHNYSFTLGPNHLFLAAHHEV